jgi:hypothetical protein
MQEKIESGKSGKSRRQKCAPQPVILKVFKKTSGIPLVRTVGFSNFEQK